MKNVAIKFDDDKSIDIKVSIWEDQEEIDVDVMLRIDYSNILAEISSFPVILNRLGLLLAEAENRVKEKELELRVFKAKLREQIRNDYADRKIKTNLNMIDDAKHSDKTYLAKNKVLNKTCKERDYINSIYWSAKAKADLLQKLALTVQPGDIDPALIVNTFNGVVISNKKKLID